MKKILIYDMDDLDPFYNETQKAYVFPENVGEIIFEDTKEFCMLNASIFAPNADITINYDFQICGNIKCKYLKVEGKLICCGTIKTSYLSSLVGIKAKKIFTNKAVVGEVAAEKIVADYLSTHKIVYVDDIKIRQWGGEPCNDVRKVVSLSW